jgi:hypothetical protein
MDKDGKPESDVNVIALPANVLSEEALAAAIVVGRTSADGMWLSPILEPGKYDLYASAPGFGRSPESVKAAEFMRASATEVGISPSGSANVHLTLTVGR